jgi:hypothetical protein
MGARMDVQEGGSFWTPERAGPWVMLALALAAVVLIVVTVFAVWPIFAEVSMPLAMGVVVAWGLGFLSLAALAGLGIERCWKPHPRHR